MFFLSVSTDVEARDSALVVIGESFNLFIGHDDDAVNVGY